MEDQQKQQLSPLVVMMPSPSIGHLIPLVEFAKRLLRHHNLLVTFLIPTDGPPPNVQTTVLRSLPPGISYLFLPPADLSDQPPNTNVVPLISLTVLRSLPSLHQSLLSLTTSHRISALVVDLFGTDAFDIAADLNIPSYLYSTSPAMLVSFSFYLPQLDKEIHGEFKDLPEPVKIPGCVPVHGKDLLDQVQDRTDEAYKCFLYHSKRYRLAQHIIVNTFPELEPGAIEFLLHKDEPEPEPQQVYPVGPLVNEDKDSGAGGGAESEYYCLKWLDEQPDGSVIFVCFGTGGTLSSTQTEELALGLESSEQSFLWVVKCPHDKVANASNFIAESDTDPFDFLPEGFVERTRGRGLVVPYWAPQAQVLSHASIGGFVTHCGWNSVLESVVNGVPLVTWPLYAEQRMNAVLVTQGVKVALRPKVNEQNGLVEKEEIASVVRRLMEGEEGNKLRHKIKDLKEAAAKALGENGSSTNHISQLALKWKAGVSN